MCGFKFLRKNFLEFGFIIGILIVFLCGSLPYLSLPGLSHDESLTPKKAFGYLNENDNSLFKLMRNLSFYDLMVDSKVSSFNSFAYVFVFYFFGVSIYSIRLVSILFGLAFFVIFYFFVRDFFNQRIAMFSLILVSTLPTLIFYMRVSIDSHSWLIPVFACLLFFSRFYRKKKLVDLGIGCLLFGFGLYYKLLFWWFAVAFLIALFFLKRGFYFRKKELIIGFLFFTLGMLPLILWNIGVPFENNTVSYVLKHSQGHIPFIKFGTVQFDQALYFNFMEKSRLSIGDKLFIRFKNVSDILGNRTLGWKTFLPSFNKGIFFAAVIFSLMVIFFDTIKQERNKILFILIIILTIFLESAILSWSSVEFEVLILIPFCLILSANLLNYLYKHSKILAYALLGLVIVFNLLTLFGAYNILISGLDMPDEFPSGNVYLLAKYLQENQIYHPISVSGHLGSDTISTNVAFLTSLKVRPIDLIAVAELNESRFVEELKREFSSPDKMFVIPNAGRSSRLSLVNGILKDLNKTMVVNKTFYLGNGDLEYLLFQVKE